MKPFSDQVFKTLDALVPALAYEGCPLGCDITSPDSVRLWLTKLWYLIQSSVPLMETARDQLVSRYSADPFTPRLVEYLEDHIAEEKDHDAWLLEDLEQLGCEKSRLLTTMAPPSVALLAGSQYYYIYHHHPVTLLGYIALSEGYAPRPKWIEDMQANSPVPAETWRTLRLHSTEDIFHREELSALLDDVPADPVMYRQFLIANAIRSAHGWANVLKDSWNTINETRDDRIKTAVPQL